ALGVADEVGRRLGEQLTVVHNLDLELGAGRLLELRREVCEHRGELIVLGGEGQRHAGERLVRSARGPESEAEQSGSECGNGRRAWFLASLVPIGTTISQHRTVVRSA